MKLRCTRFAGGMKLRGRLLGIAAAMLLALAVLLAAGCGGSSEAKNNPSGPADAAGRLQIAQTYSDNGNIPVGQMSEHKFELKNTGTGPLNLGQLEVKRLEGC